METYIVTSEDRRLVEAHCAGVGCTQKCGHTTRAGLVRLLTRLRWMVVDEDRAYCPKCSEAAQRMNAQRHNRQRATA